MPSQDTPSQAQQQQAGVRNPGSAARSSASTSKLRLGDGAVNQQQSSSGVQGGCRSEPIRTKPSYPAPSTISPSDSISVWGDETGPSKQTEPKGNFKRPQNGYSKPSARKPVVASRQTPPVHLKRADSPLSWEPDFFEMQDQYDEPWYFAPDSQRSVSGTSQTSFRTPSASTQQAPLSSRSMQSGSNEYAAPSQRSASTSNNNDYPPSSSRSSGASTVQSTVAPSTARMTNQEPFEIPQSVTSRSASSWMGRTSTGSSRHNGAVGNWVEPFQQSASPQPPQGISIGVPPAAQMHFHYNQVDNRQLHINNNAPQNVLTNNNQVYNTDNSNHHNTHGPRANTYNTTTTNVGNTHTNVSQKATSSYYGQRQDFYPPSESMPIRGKQYTKVKQVSFNDWTDKRKVKYKEVPDDRPC